MNTLNKPWLVVIPAGRWQIKGIQVALDCGMNVLAFDSDPKALGLSVATKSIIINVRDSKAVLAAINSSGIFPEGVINFASEVGMSTAAEIRKKYRLTGPNINLTKLLTDKSKQRRIWQKHGVPNPNWRVFSDVNHVLKIVQHIGYPCIIKPVDNAGSRGVTKVENINDLINAANSALRFSKQGLALIEAFMEGTEYTVETFGNGINNYVLAVTKKKKVSVTKGTVAIELSTASDIKKEKIVSDSAISALNALGYNYGPGHTEVIIDKNNKPGLVEAAGRGGGFMVFERMVQSISGFDIVTATILQSIGLISPVKVKKKCPVILRFIASKEGIVHKISGLSKANRISGVEVGVFVTLGQKVGNVQGDGDRLAYILSTGRTLDVASSLADAAESLIEITVK